MLSWKEWVTWGLGLLPLDSHVDLSFCQKLKVSFPDERGSLCRIMFVMSFKCQYLFEVIKMEVVK